MAESIRYGNRFQFEGVITAKRELKSSKPGSKWVGYVAKLALIGESFDINLTDAQYAAVAVGQAVTVQGRISQNGPRTNLDAEIIRDQAAAPAK